MSGRVLQQVLTSGEYDEFDDIIIVEGEFVEFGVSGPALGQVILGISPFHLIKATRTISDYKKDPGVYYNIDVDPYQDGLEISSVTPLCVLEVKYLSTDYEIVVNVQGDIRYYLLCNTDLNGDLEDTWFRWVDRVQYIQRDPYHYIRNMLDEHNLPYPDHYMELELEELMTKTTEITETNPASLANIGNTADAIDIVRVNKGSKQRGNGSKGDTRVSDDKLAHDRKKKTATKKDKGRRKNKKMLLCL